MNAAHPPEDTWGANLDARANQLADRVAKAIERAAQQYHSEADFRREAAAILGDAASEAGLEIVPGDEFVVACGRVDALYNRLVLEYKRPGILHKLGFPPSAGHMTMRPFGCSRLPRTPREACTRESYEAFCDCTT